MPAACWTAKREETALKRPSVLVIGYGNPGRLDDGLGPACAERIEALALPGVTVDADYQLTVEDAAAVAQHDYVVFADASLDARAPFVFAPVQPLAEITFTSHSLPPGAVLAFAHSMFDARVQAFALGIRGYRFNAFGERLSPGARRNLAAAVRFLAETIRFNRFAEYADPRQKPSTKEPRVVMGLTAADLN